MNSYRIEVEILKAAAAGDREAFGAVVEKYQSLVCAITLGATSNLDRSEDLAQQAFVNAWQHLGQLRDLSKFHSWLCTIARNLVNREMQNHKRDILRRAVPVDEASNISSDGHEPSEAVIRKEQVAAVQEALESLPENYREVLVLFYRQERSIKSVAEQLMLSEEAVKSRLLRGRNMLREHIEIVVEKTLERTKPGKAFATAVMAGIAGIAASSSAATAGVAATAGAKGAGAGISAAISGVTGTIIAVVATVAVLGGGVAAYKHLVRPGATAMHKPATEVTAPVATTISEAEPAPVALPDEAPQSSPPVQSDSNAIATASSVSASFAGAVTLQQEEFIFKPKGVLSGVIADANTALPIKDVRVRLMLDGGLEQHSAETDANGMYYFKTIKKGGSYEVTLGAKDHITLDYWARPQDHVVLAKGNEVVKDFQLTRGARIDIQAVDEDGKPLKGVSVDAGYVSDEAFGRGSKQEHCQTGSDGVAVLGGLPPAEYLVIAWHKDYALAGEKVTLKDVNEVKAMVFEMKKGVAIEGRAICSNGLPAGGWEVSAAPSWWHSVHCPYDYPIDETGRFVLEHILPGDHEVTIFVPQGRGSMGLWSTKVRLPPEEGLLTLDIPYVSPQQRVNISGAIEYVSGESGRGVWLHARSESGNYGSVYVDQGQRDFIIIGLAPDLYTIRIDVMAGDAEGVTVRNVKAPSEGNVIRITVKKQLTLRGRVVDKLTGRAIPRFKVKAGVTEWQEVDSLEGCFDVEAREEDSHSVSVKADGYAVKTVEISAEANEPALIELGKGGTIEVTVMDEHRKPVQGARLDYRYAPNEKSVAVSDTNGRVMIKDITDDTTSQWFVIRHRDYAPEVVQIEAKEDSAPQREIVLRKGGDIEGYVYDRDGKALAGERLYFLSESPYSYWEQNRSRLGTVVTDANGYYHLGGLPEALCYGFRSRPDEQVGVVTTSILPRNGQTLRLDFGGLWWTTGRLLRGGVPMGNVKMLVRGSQAGHETAFVAYAMTDSNGWFTLWGIPSGRRYVYWSIPGASGWEQWVEAGTFDFASQMESNFDDLNVETADVTIMVGAEDGSTGLDQLNLMVKSYNEKHPVMARQVGQKLPRKEPNEPYVFSYLAPGRYEVVAQRPSHPDIHKVFEIAPGIRSQVINLQIPSGTASIAGGITYNPPEEYPSPLYLRSRDKTITVYMQLRTDGRFEMGNLPAGDYIMERYSVLSGQPLKEFSLMSGEKMSLDVEVDNVTSGEGGYLVVMFVAEDSLLLPGVRAWLEKQGREVHPHFDGDIYKSFSASPEEWILRAEYKGYRPIAQMVTVKSKKKYNTQEILRQVVIHMVKE